MANPQCENGYTKISNEILEALAKIRINGEASQVLLVILRKTYGFNKKKDKISLSQFVLSTGIKRPNVCRALNKLISMNIIIQIDKDNITIYQFNKDFDVWKPLSKQIPRGKALSKRITPIIQTDNKRYPKRYTQKKKETITKDKYVATLGVAWKEIKKVMDIFYQVNPTLSWNNKTTLKACADLIKKFGLENTIKMAEQIVAVQGKQYAPTATTPYQMKEKLAQFKIYFDRQKNNKPQFTKVS